MDICTHQKTNSALCGTPLAVSEGYSQVELHTSEQMIVDHFDLVHGGFIFGLADYAAMIAVNDPNVALGAATVRFLKPVRVHERLVAEAKIASGTGKKRLVDVAVTREGTPVFEGSFTCFVLEKHVLA